MSRPKFLADHDLNEHIVTGVIRRAPSAEFNRVREVGLHDCSDAEVLEYAVARGFILAAGKPGVDLVGK